MWVLDIVVLNYTTQRLSTPVEESYRPGIRAVSLDITGTLLATREPVVKSYHDAALWARLPDPPSRDEMKAAFCDYGECVCGGMLAQLQGPGLSEASEGECLALFGHAVFLNAVAVAAADACCREDDDDDGSVAALAAAKCEADAPTRDDEPAPEAWGDELIRHLPSCCCSVDAGVAGSRLRGRDAGAAVPRMDIVLSSALFVGPLFVECVCVTVCAQQEQHMCMCM